MYLAGNEKPDFRTICNFRRDNKELIEEAFKKTIILAKTMKILKLGHLSTDGTKIKANASNNYTLSEEKLKRIKSIIEKGIFIRSEAKIFLMWHNNRQDWKYRKTDLETIPHRKLPEDFKIDANSLPITEGKVHFIRQVKGDGTISVLNEDFDVVESLAYEYVWATIDTKQEQLRVYYQERNAEEAILIKIFGYKIDENSKIFEEKQ